jgi:hypothetical protein
MAYQGIGTGLSPNDNGGDSLLEGALKVNSNFEEIYNALGDGNTINLSKDREISAGAGLTGGGTLNQNITLNVGEGDGIDVTDNSVAVDSTVVRTSGTQTIGGNKTFTGDVSFEGTVNATIEGSIDTASNLTRSVISGDGLTGGGVLNQNITLNVGEGDGIDVSTDTVAVNSTVVRTSGTQTIGGTKTFTGDVFFEGTVNANIEGSIDTASNLTRSVISGDGLTGGGVLNQNITLNVGGGDGIDVSTDTVAVDSTVVRTTRSVTSGNGLTGGGALNENITLNVGEGDGIDVSTDTVAVDSTVVRTSGTQTIGGDKTFTGDVFFEGTVNATIEGSIDTASNLTRSVISGNGLTGGGTLNKNITLNVGKGDGIDVSTDTVAVDSTVVRTTRSVIGGIGLNGGGALNENITLNVGKGDGIDVFKDTVAVDSTVVRISGTQTIGGTKTFSSSINGNLSGTATNATNINLDTRNASTNTHYITFGTSVSGNQRLYTDTGITYQPSTNTLTASNFNGTATNCSRSVIAGNGLTGGGALNENRTLNVGKGTGIDVDADTISINSSYRFPKGTRMLFQQTSAPTGWTKVTGVNNRALRVVTGDAGSGGTESFTAVFASDRSVPLPQHSHGITEPNNGDGHSHGITEPNNGKGHQHSYDRSSSGTGTSGGSTGVFDFNQSSNTNFSTTGISINRSTTGIKINNAGTAGATMNFAVRYIDVIIAERN